MPGLFITFEGVEGAGKSLQTGRLYEYFKKKGSDVILTREPGGTRISEAIREIIIDRANVEMDPTTEAYLYASARAQHIRELILPKLASGGTVICDRFLDSSLAYQGFARGMGIPKIEEINKPAVCGVMPDITFFLDLPPEIGFSRKKGDTLDRLEAEGLVFHRAVYDGYKELLKMYPNRIKAIDASRTPDEIHGAVVASIEQFCKR